MRQYALPQWLQSFIKQYELYAITFKKPQFFANGNGELNSNQCFEVGGDTQIVNKTSCVLTFNGQVFHDVSDLITHPGTLFTFGNINDSSRVVQQSWGVNLTKQLYRYRALMERTAHDLISMNCQAHRKYAPESRKKRLAACSEKDSGRLRFVACSSYPLGRSKSWQALVLSKCRNCFVGSCILFRIVQPSSTNSEWTLQRSTNSCQVTRLKTNPFTGNSVFLNQQMIS